MILQERIELLRPMPVRQAVHDTPWMSDALVRTDGARARLRRWCDAGFPPSPDAASAFIDGPEPAIRSAIVAAIARIAVPPVRWYLSRHVVFVCTGRHTRGWQGRWPVFAHPTDEPPQVIVVSGATEDGEELASLAGHELGHAWLADIAVESPLVADLAKQDPGLLARLAREWQIPAAQIESTLKPARLEEHRVATLAREWGFTGTAADPDGCRRRYRLAE